MFCVAGWTGGRIVGMGVAVRVGSGVSVAGGVKAALGTTGGMSCGVGSTDTRVGDGTTDSGETSGPAGGPSAHAERSKITTMLAKELARIRV